MSKKFLAALILLVIFLLMKGKDILTSIRGLRNNNPGNIRDTGIDWQGKTGNDGSFITFDTMSNGIRAITRNLHTQIFKYGRNTVRKLITAYAPPSENDTESYIKNVSDYINRLPDEIIMWDTDKYNLTKAIIRQEVGVTGMLAISELTIQEGVNAA